MKHRITLTPLQREQAVARVNETQAAQSRLDAWVQGVLSHHDVEGRVDLGPLLRGGHEIVVEDGLDEVEEDG